MLRVLVLLFIALIHGATAAGVDPLEGELFVHDPSLIVKEQGTYHLFHTGMGVASKFSTNRVHWTRGQPVFQAPPAWTTNAVPGFRGYFWAPDIVLLDGKYHVYYSVSTFGKQRSAIGLVTSPALDPASPEYGWTDQGAVIESRPGDPFNAIDPSLLRDRDGKLWMAFGSFWRGIYLVELDPRTGKRVAPDAPTHRLAYHESIEAATLHRRGDDYFLFVNWGACCRGTNSTYEVRVGRASQVTGPYRDRAGKALVDGGGTLFLRTEGADIGPGHVAVLADAGGEFVSYHVYDATARGRSRLRLRPLTWDADGWPVAQEAEIQKR